jgi:hypothetical protein
MAEEPDGPLGLQFERAELAGSGVAPACASCGSTVHGVYYDIAGATTCERCAAELQLAAANESGGASRFVRAAALGLLAAIAGSLAWYGIRRLTGYEFGILAIGVGLLVGGAVRKGARARGGAGYQALAMFLTYSSIVVTYVPEIVSGMQQPAGEAPAGPSAQTASPTSADPAPSAARPAAAQEAPGASAAPAEGSEPLSLGGFFMALAFLLALAYAAPFLVVFEDASALMGLLIIAIGLYEAWKLNRRQELAITGPHRLNAPATARE